MKDIEAIRECKEDANSAKERLMSIESKLRSLGAEKEANSLEKIIIKLEVWQNK